MKSFSLRLVVFSASLFSCIVIQAQTTEVVIDKSTVAALRFLNYNGVINKEELSAKLYKPFVRPYYLAYRAKLDKFEFTETLKQAIADVNELLTIKYKAMLFDSLKNPSDEISESKLFNYYQTHAEKFVQLAQISFVQVTISPQSIKDSLQILKELKGKLNLFENDQKFSNEQYSINKENNVEINSAVACFEKLRNVKPNTWVKCAKGNNLRYLFITDSRPESSLPFEKVKDDILKKIQLELIEKRNERISKLSDSISTIKLSDCYTMLADNPTANPNADCIFANIGSYIVNTTYLGTIQRVFPYFHFSNNMNEFKELLRQYLAIPLTKAFQMKELSENEIKTLEKIKQINQIQIEAEIFENRLRASITPSENEVSLSYKTHLGDFSSKGVCTFLKAELQDSSSFAIADATKKMLEVAKGKIDENTKVKKDGSYTIVSELKYSYLPSDEIGKLIQNTPIKNVSKLYHPLNTGYSILIMPLENISPKAKSFEEVKAFCTDIVRNEKISQLTETIKFEVFKTFQFRIVN